MGKLDLKSTRIYENTMGDILCAFAHLGEEVYLSDDKSFNTFTKGKLIGVSYICGDSVWVGKDNPWTKYPFVGKSVEDDGLEKSAHYKYFIPVRNAKFKEKKLRPFNSIHEFCNETCCEVVGEDIITIRTKKDKQEKVLLFTGYSETAVHLGAYLITFNGLLCDYEFLYNDEWYPFGIEE